MKELAGWLGQLECSLPQWTAAHTLAVQPDKHWAKEVINCKKGGYSQGAKL